MVIPHFLSFEKSFLPFKATLPKTQEKLWTANTSNIWQNRGSNCVPWWRLFHGTLVCFFPVWHVPFIHLVYTQINKLTGETIFPSPILPINHAELVTDRTDFIFVRGKHNMEIAYILPELLNTEQDKHILWRNNFQTQTSHDII